MFGFGKTKMDAQTLCRDQWIKISSEERKSIWRHFVENSDDEALRSFEFEEFCLIMIIAYAKFNQVAAIIANGMNSDPVFEYHVCMGQNVDGLGGKVEEYSKILNQTWGASPYYEGKMYDMAVAVENCIGHNLEESTKMQLANEFDQLLASMVGVFKSIKIISSY